MADKFSDYLNEVIDGGLLMYRPFLLGVASFAYNTKIHPYLGQTPFEEGQGHPVRMPAMFEMFENRKERLQGCWDDLGCFGTMYWQC